MIGDPFVQIGERGVFDSRQSPAVLLDAAARCDRVVASCLVVPQANGVDAISRPASTAATAATTLLPTPVAPWQLSAEGRRRDRTVGMVSVRPCLLKRPRNSALPSSLFREE